MAVKKKTKLDKPLEKKSKINFNKIKEFVINIFKSHYFWMCFPFIILDLVIFLIGKEINYTNYKFWAPILFNISWIVLFVGVSISFKKKIGKIIYIVLCSVFTLLYFVNGVYYSMTRNMFDFSLVESAGESTPYIMSTLLNCNIFVYFGLFLIIALIIVGCKKFPDNKENNYKRLVIFIIVFLVIHTITPFTMGKANKSLTWNSWRNARNIYNSFNDSNKSFKTSGFYEYTIRNFYITYLKTEEKIKEEDIEFLNTAYVEKKATKNNYTGKLKGMNLIIVQLEGIDKWILNKETTPTMYKLMSEGINFDKHYSFYSGGGSTFNSEFAVNTGYTTPLSFTKNAYSYNKNTFPNTLAKLFKNEGYSVNAFHMNTGEYYSRTLNYLNWGYDNYYGLLDIDKYENNTQMLDRELILNEKFNELLFPTEGNFVDYIITYSNHVPFSNTDGVCKMLYDLDQEEKKNKGINTEFVQMSEEECVRRQSKETDYMFELILKNLKEKNLLKNTAIVVFTDHYLFTLNDQSIIAKYKNTSNNLINNTPWFIWSNNLESNKISKVTSQLNILPTILNLYGITYNENDYIAQDALSNKYNPIVFFNDYSWYDGYTYVDGGEIKNGKKLSKDKLEEKNEYVNYMAKKNDLTLKFNYFKKQSSE